MGYNKHPERAEAKRLGLKFYFTGRPCVNGHIALRYLKGDCVECIKMGKTLYPEDLEKKKQRKKRWDEENDQYRREYREENLERDSENNKQWRDRNKEKGREATRRYRDSKRRPEWRDKKAIREFYKKCPRWMVVDHIVPLDGFTAEGYPVCGLHVAWNLQYLTASENHRKHRYAWL